MHKSLSRFFVLALAVMALMMLVGSVAAVGPTVTPGDQTSGWTEGGALRLKGQPGEGYYLGVHDVGLPGNRVDAALSINAAGSYPFTFSYDSVANDLTSTMPSKGINLVWDLDSSPAPGCAPGDWDMMRINVRDGKNNAGVGLSSVTLNAATLGSGTFGTPDVVGTPGHQYWTVTDFDFSSDFTFAANLDVDPAFSGNESVRVEIIVGCAPPPPSVTPVSEDPLVCDEGTVNIVIDDVADLYGYEFIVEYDDSLVDADGEFVDGWFDPNGYGIDGAGWEAVCSGGECKFGQTRSLPDSTELATSDPQVIASIDFTSDLPLPTTPTFFDVTVKDVKLTDKDSFVIPGAVGGALSVEVCGTATVSGNISLQGRPQQPGDISGPPSVFEVSLTGPYGTFSDFASDTDGSYSIDVKYTTGGTLYDIEADHSVYLPAADLGYTGSTGFTVNGDVSGKSTTLLGGDATANNAVGIGDIVCINDNFGDPSPGFGTCGTGPAGTPDVNDDGVVNIQDLALAAGNYEITTTGGSPNPQPW